MATEGTPNLPRVCDIVSERQYHILKHIYCFGRTLKETADRMGWSVRTVKAEHSAALLRLKDAGSCELTFDEE